MYTKTFIEEQKLRWALTHNKQAHQAHVHLHDPVPSYNSMALVTREGDRGQRGRLAALRKA